MDAGIVSEFQPHPCFCSYSRVLRLLLGTYLCHTSEYSGNPPQARHHPPRLPSDRRQVPELPLTSIIPKSDSLETSVGEDDGHSTIEYVGFRLSWSCMRSWGDRSHAKLTFSDYNMYANTALDSLG